MNDTLLNLERRQKMRLRDRVGCLEGDVANTEQRLRRMENYSPHVKCCGCKKVLHVGLDAIELPRMLTATCAAYVCSDCVKWVQFERRGESRK